MGDKTPDIFTYTFGSEQYEQCYMSLQTVMKDFAISQYLMDTVPDCFLSQKDKAISIELLLNGSVKSSFGEKIPGDIINTLMLAESGSFAKGYGTDLLDALLDGGEDRPGQQYEIFIDGVYGILIKNKSDIPLCVLGFDVNEDALMVRQIQGINNTTTNKIHRDINKFIRRKLLIHTISILAKKLGKNRIFYQKSKYNYRAQAKDNIKGYDNVFNEMEFEEEEKSFIQHL
ncbi:MAG: hypothetical protein WC875_03160 [Candidatus Absconditabacterales bacterium]